jgi:hypothetical protein
MTKATEDLIASRNILATNIRMFHEGNRDLYRVVAGELRKLLCDGSNSLLPRLFPHARFHPLLGPSLPDHLKDGLLFQYPALIDFDGKGGSRIIALFDKTAEPIPLEDWLAQDFFNEHITVRELIRSVADKEDKHADPKYNKTLTFARSIKLVNEHAHIQNIVAIGEYVSEIIDAAILNNPQLQSP